MDNSTPHGSNESPITRQCTATSKRSGNRCRKPAMRGRTVCLAHGGRTPRGIASPSFKTGKYSRSLPGHLVADYERTLTDPKLLSVRDDIALMDALILTTLGQLDEDATPAKDRRTWRAIGQLIDRRRRLVETEVKHLVLAREVITAEQAIALVSALVEIVKRYVPDPLDRQAIVEEIHELMSQQGEIFDA